MRASWQGSPIKAAHSSGAPFKSFAARLESTVGQCRSSVAGFNATITSARSSVDRRRSRVRDVKSRIDQAESSVRQFESSADQIESSVHQVESSESLEESTASPGESSVAQGESSAPRVQSSAAPYRPIVARRCCGRSSTPHRPQLHVNRASLIASRALSTPPEKQRARLSARPLPSQPSDNASRGRFNALRRPHTRGRRPLNLSRGRLRRSRVRRTHSLHHCPSPTRPMT